MKTTICLVRHGETEWNALGKLQGREDVDLSPTGSLQAALTGTYLRSTGPWEAVLSSPLIRARGTAEIIKNRLALDGIEILDDLIERDLGMASGLTRSEVAKRYPNDVPGQEPLMVVKTRMMSCLEYALRRYPERHLVMVSHGASINALLSLLSKGSIGTGKSILKNACLNIVSHSVDKWSIDVHNFTQHLELV